MPQKISITRLEQTPSALSPLAPQLTFLTATHHALLPLLELSQAFHFFEHMFEEILATHDVEMAFDFRVFLGETVDFLLGKTAAETGVEFTRKLEDMLAFNLFVSGKVLRAYDVVELAKEFGVKEEIGGRGELVSYGIEEDLWTVVFVLLGGALLALHCEEA